MMPDIVLPPLMEDYKGVQMNAPTDIFDRTAIRNSVNMYLKDKSDKRVALVAVANLDENGKPQFNFVLATKANDDFFIEAWFGKKWGKPIDGGLQGVWYL